MLNSNDLAGLTRQLELHATILIGFVGALWILELFDSIFLRGALNRYGIRPRTSEGIFGIVFAPLLHGNLRHLATNTVPLIVLGWLIMLRQTSDFFIVTAVAWLVSGLGVWLFGSPRTNHIGASGLVFGYFGFLLLRGYFEQSAIAILTAVIVGLLYGSLIWGILPIRRGMSWQGHLFGFAGGGLAAKYLPQLQQIFEGLGVVS
ncbi:rhomboid family intramembrane serine protease [Leptolyngbya sp. FACHB-671]|uniref:rhomboid family intramembrane serine protease n=1 Tax=Leptolyngbya sp. FACHB-671 TaxID=2692812 RepID=UPI00168844BF|nr:rhomboid family intramembrane serine protease [Leptolyngbya sp. FACHB-671]MBD2069260.1 rhomboid family intramembrane serine protease [Leptolyngbya sp. FACHB-671]